MPNKKTKIQEKPAQIKVRRAEYEMSKLLSEEEKTETIQVPFFGDTELGKIQVGGSVTRNMGDFNFVRVEVSIELPCFPELSEAKRVYEIGSTFVSENVKKELDYATGRGTNAGNEKETKPRSETAGIRRRLSV